MMRFSKLNMRNVPSNSMPPSIPLTKYFAAYCTHPRGLLGLGGTMVFFIVIYGSVYVYDDKINYLSAHHRHSSSLA